MRRSVSVLLGEPNLLVREKMAGVLARHPSIWCVVQVGQPADLVRGAKRLQPDFVLVDLGILRTLDTIRALRKCAPAASLMALVEVVSEPYREEIERLGLDGLIEKGRVEEGLVAEIRALCGAEESGDGQPS